MKLLTTSLETLINRYLLLDKQSKKKQFLLEGKAILIEFTHFNLKVQLCFLHQQVILKTTDFMIADTIIRGTPLGFLRLLMDRENRKQILSDNVFIEGNLEIAQQFINLLDELEIDWEEYLSKWTGDFPAYQAGRFVKKIKKNFIYLRATLTQHLDEYVHEEVRWFPAKEALDDFFSDVDMLRMDIDRLQVRVEQLRSQL